MKNEVESLEKAGQIMHAAGALDHLSDPTEPIRRELVDEINSHAAERASLKSEWGQVWDTKQLQEDFEVHGFMAPYCVVVRKSDGKRGSIMFQHMPRFYFGFQED